MYTRNIRFTHYGVFTYYVIRICSMKCNYYGLLIISRSEALQLLRLLLISVCTLRSGKNN